MVRWNRKYVCEVSELLRRAWFAILQNVLSRYWSSISITEKVSRIAWQQQQVEYGETNLTLPMVWITGLAIDNCGKWR